MSDNLTKSGPKPIRSSHPFVLLALFMLLLTGLFRGVFAAPADATTLHLPLVVGRPILLVSPTTASFGSVTDIAHAGDERIFVTEKPGIIRVYRPSTGAVSVFLDLTDRVVSSGAEQGLLGLAFHPDFAENGMFFVSYTGKVPGFDDWNLIMSRFQVTENPDVADPGSEEFLVKVIESFEVHNGGALRFNPLDNHLYLGVGDDSQFLVAQDPKHPKGKVWRISLESAATASLNAAELSQPTAIVAERELVARGLRNPWRFAFDPQTGDLYIADVGDRKWEEIDFVPYGARDLNFGWPCIEGPEVLDSSTVGPCSRAWTFIPPVHYYQNGVDGCAVIGAAVYRPPGRPEAAPRFIFSDYCTREIQALSNSGGAWETKLLGQLDETADLLTTIGTDHEGSVYAGSFFPGPIFKLGIP